jgi:FdhD protein
MSEEQSTDWVEYTRINSGITRKKEKVVTEFNLVITINGRHLTTAIITPMMITEFVTGYLFGQKIIDDAGEIESLSIKDNLAEVKLKSKSKAPDLSLDIKSDFSVSREDIFDGVNSILKSKIYAETEAIHSGGLFVKGAKPVIITEDIGRHNALDKIIGYALINKIDLSRTFAASTGRMASDMVSKVCRANIPIIATKSAVTRAGLDIGEKCGLTLVGFVRNKGMRLMTDTGEIITQERMMKVYTNPQRIIL